MRNLCFSILLLISVGLNSQSKSEYNNPDYQSYQKTNEIVSELKSNDYDKIDTPDYNLSGTRHFLGHYETPKLRKPMSLSYHVSSSMNNFPKSEGQLEYCGDVLKKI